jgi:membrane protease YdiL (CAAX protease family)
VLKTNELPLFFILTLLGSAAAVGLAVAAQDENFAILAVFTPTLSATLLTALNSGRPGLRKLFLEQTRRRFSRRWLLITLFLFPLLASLAVLIHSTFGGPDLALRTTALLPDLLVILLISVGEEYGWRGFALPRLQQRWSALTASLILGLIWGLWHYPASLIGTGVPLEMPFAVFLVWVILGTILFTWVYNNTGSMLIAILMHSAANATFNYLPLLPEFTGQIGTFWIFLGMLALAVVVVVARYGSERLVRS